MGNESKVSWFLVILLMVVFPPLGVFFLIEKIANDKTAILTLTKTLYLVAAYTVVHGVVLVSLMQLSAVSIDLVVTAVVFYIIGTLACLAYAYSITHTGKKYRQYIDVVVNKEELDMDAIATMVGDTLPIAGEFVRKMTTMGYFKDAYIDIASNKLILPHKLPTSYKDWQQKVLQCQCCGANAVAISGTIAKCEYCDSPIQG